MGGSSPISIPDTLEVTLEVITTDTTTITITGITRDQGADPVVWTAIATSRSRILGYFQYWVIKDTWDMGISRI